MLVSTSQMSEQETSGVCIVTDRVSVSIHDVGGTLLVSIIDGKSTDLVLNPVEYTYTMSQFELERDMYEQQVNGWMG